MRRRHSSLITLLFAYLGQIPNVIGVEQELLQAACIPKNLLGHGGQGTVALVHELHLPIAALEDWNALEHHERLRPTLHWNFRAHTHTHRPEQALTRSISRLLQWALALCNYVCITGHCSIWHQGIMSSASAC